jgi:hypothetical protein
MPRYRKIARLFTSVIRTRVDRGNPRIPSPPMTCCCKIVGAFYIRDRGEICYNYLGKT